MTRKQIGGVAVAIACAFLLATALLALMPLWLPLLMINPSLINPLEQWVMKGMSRQFARAMLGGHPPTKPSRVMP